MKKGPIKILVQSLKRRRSSASSVDSISKNFGEPGRDEVILHKSKFIFVLIIVVIFLWYTLGDRPIVTLYNVNLNLLFILIGIEKERVILIIVISVFVLCTVVLFVMHKQ